jgi:hypothetical protein
MLDAFPPRSGDHLAQNFLRKIKLIFSIILHLKSTSIRVKQLAAKIFYLNKRSGNTVLIQITPNSGNTVYSGIFLPKRFKSQYGLIPLQPISVAPTF